MRNQAHAEALPFFSRRLSQAQYSVPLHFPCRSWPVPPHQLLQHKPIPARGALPLMRPARPAWSHICMEQPRPWHYQPRPPILHLIPKALTFPAWELFLDSTMHALAFLSSKHGSTPSRLATVTLLRVSPTATWQDTVRMQTRPSWVISPSNARTCGQPSPGLLPLSKSHIF
jgi:hypothetical protein